MKETLVIR